MKVLIIDAQAYSHDGDRLDIEDMRSRWSDEVNTAFDAADTVLLQFGPCAQVLKAPTQSIVLLAQRDRFDGPHVLTQLAPAGVVSHRRKATT